MIRTGSSAPLGPPGSRGSGTEGRGLPRHYYLRHFHELLEFAETHLGHLLGPREQGLMAEFRALDLPSQCLFVRLVCRKPRVFLQARLRYPEIGPLAPPLRTLRAGGWIGNPGRREFEEVLAVLDRQSLGQGLMGVVSGLPRQGTKRLLTRVAREFPDRGRLLAILAPGLIALRRHRWVEYLKFIYFGESGRGASGMTRFTLRDLGLLRVYQSPSGYAPRFDDLREARQAFAFSRMLAALDAPAGTAPERVRRRFRRWPEPVSDRVAAIRDRLVLRLAEELAGRAEPDAALDVLRVGTSAACRERLIRQLLSAGRKDEARTLLEAAVTDPASDEEGLFARDLLDRRFAGGSRRSRETARLRAAEHMCLDDAWAGAPEMGVAERLRREGRTVWRTENGLWRTLFGLTFWNELFRSGDAARHSPFDSRPAVIEQGRFAREHASAVDKRLAEFADPDVLIRRLLAVAARHYGTRNGIFRWTPGMLEPLQVLIARDGPAAARMLDLMARDYRGMRHGFPDLLVADGEALRFVEVKAEGDRLRRSQLVRLEQLQRAGFRADVLRVRWRVNPSQRYVVVDVETTGGSGAGHRVTEVAAVVVQNGKLSYRFHSLVHPERPIPARISRLTGISDADVREAPRFADIAGELGDVLADGIFVAHNVNFDYGFLQREFARLGRSFVRPKLCTCAGMRRHFPGHRSYALDALCRAYDIPLVTHHRALCDAEAAAQLLLMLNERRSAENISY